MTDTREQTPEDLLALIQNSDEGRQLEICQLALTASKEAQRCFLEGHSIEIDNLHAHVRELSIALMNAINGDHIDPGIVAIARANSDG